MEYAALGRSNLPAGGNKLEARRYSFMNERNHLMKEDDPLLATALAVIALTHSLR